MALDLIGTPGGAVSMVAHSMTEDSVEQVMRHPAVMIASDGWTLGPDASGVPHPRSARTFARALGRYVRGRGLVSLEEAVRKMTSLPARRLGWTDRGILRPGAVADLVAFDPEQVRDRATYRHPTRGPEGISHVVVGGRVVVEHGSDTGVAVGRVLRRAAA